MDNFLFLIRCGAKLNVQNENGWTPPFVLILVNLNKNFENDRTDLHV